MVGTGKSIGELCKVACNDLTELSLMRIQKWRINVDVTVLYTDTDRRLV